MHSHDPDYIAHINRIQEEVGYITHLSERDAKFTHLSEANITFFGDDPEPTVIQATIQSEAAQADMLPSSKSKFIFPGHITPPSALPNPYILPHSSSNHQNHHVTGSGFCLTCCARITKPVADNHH